MSLIKAMMTVAGMTGISRVMGFIRDILTAAILGAGPVADAFFVALKLPNFFRRITAEGAFSVSFVPIYSEALEKEGRGPADKFAGNIFMLMLTGLSVFTLLGLLAMPFVIYLVAPGFSGDTLRYDLAVEMSRITFPYLLLMSLTALLGGVLNAHNKFAPFAFAPVLFNLTLISALILQNFFTTAGHALAWGVLVAGLFQFLFLVTVAYRWKFYLKLRLPKLDLKARRVLKLMGPGVVGAGVIHINLFADLIIASFLPTGAISYLYYADRLNQLPMGMVGIAVGTALLPMLSKALAAEKTDQARDLFNRALEYCFLLALPAAAALAVIPTPIIDVLFERGAFNATDTLATSGVLMAYALGLPAYVAVKIFSTAHWARQDTVTPVRVAVIGTVANVVLSLIFIQYIGVAGIALGTGLTGWLQFVLHVRLLRDHKAARFDERFLFNILKIGISTLLMVLGLFLIKTFLPSVNYSILALVALVAGGLVIYALSALMTGLIRVKDIRKLISNTPKTLN